MHAPPPEGPWTAGAWADAQVLLLLADLRRRLGPACRDWGEDAFEALLREIALRRVRWDEEVDGH